MSGDRADEGAGGMSLGDMQGALAETLDIPTDSVGAGEERWTPWELRAEIVRRVDTAVRIAGAAVGAVGGTFAPWQQGDGSGVEQSLGALAEAAATSATHAESTTAELAAAEREVIAARRERDELRADLVTLYQRVERMGGLGGRDPLTLLAALLPDGEHVGNLAPLATALQWATGTLPAPSTDTNGS